MSILRIAGLLIAVGVIFTVWDYKNWRIEETKNYGHGWAENREVAPAQKLKEVYTNAPLKFRIKYPEGWDAGEMTFRDPSGRVKMQVRVEKDARDFSAIADEMAEGVTRDRSYINTETASLTVLTWEGARETKQVAMAKKNDRLYKITVTCESGVWKFWFATLEEIYRSLVLL